MNSRDNGIYNHPFTSHLQIKIYNLFELPIELSQGGKFAPKYKCDPRIKVRKPNS